MNATFPAPELISDDETLKARCQQWQQLSAIAVDTEFVRTDTFYARLGLIQLSDGAQCWLVDPLALTDLSPLADVFSNASITKVFHAPSEDLEILQSALGSVPAPIFDTQVAAALTGYGFSRGYATLVKALLDVSLDKHETRSDWTRRPLTDQQLHYAAEDVYYLAAVYPLLQEKLAELDRQQWMDEEMAGLVLKSSDVEDIDNYYRKIKAAWQLDGARLQLLQALCRWRESQARASDKPRSRVISDKLLFEIARVEPTTMGALHSIEGLHGRTVQRFGKTLLEFTAAAREPSEAAELQPLEQPLPKSATTLLKELRTIVANTAERLDLPAEILATRRDLEAIVRALLEQSSQLLPETLATGWRFRVVGESLRAQAQELQKSEER